MKGLNREGRGRGVVPKRVLFQKGWWGLQEIGAYLRRGLNRENIYTVLFTRKLTTELCSFVTPISTVIISVADPHLMNTHRAVTSEGLCGTVSSWTTYRNSVKKK